MLKNVKKEYNILKTFFLILLPLISIFGIPLYTYHNGIVLHEPIMLLIGWFFAGTGITIGYHRLFAHRSFQTHPIIDWIFMLFGSMALQNSILRWCSDHRRHHKKLDTNLDPYSIKKGFFHAHIGWMLEKTSSEISGVSDLKRKPAVIFQYKYYWIISLSLAFLLPTLIGYYFGRPIGGLLWGGVLKTTLVHHFTFFINSLCHYVGNQSYDAKTSAKDSWIMAFLTFGEGYHNYHHKFEWDYRNGIMWYNFDPSKWIIKLLSYFKLTFNLRKASESRIVEAKITTIIDKIELLSENVKQYNDKKIKNIKKHAFQVLNNWRQLELDFEGRMWVKINKYDKKVYFQKKKLYKAELQKAFHSLMLFFIELKNLHF